MMIERLMSLLFMVFMCNGLLSCAPLSITPPASTTPKHGDAWKDPTTGMEFVWVEGGSYQMGCGPWTSGCEDHEKPVHEVVVSGFWIGRYTVTQEQWMKVMGSNPSGFKKGDDYPVETVSWDDAKEYIQKLNMMSGHAFRLPTEAEWEYAARSGGKPEKYAGGSDIDAVAWYDGNSGDSTHPVGTKAPNGLGIYDMSGNLWQWCEDIFARDAYKQHRHRDPIFTDADSSRDSRRVVRGGSWADPPRSVRCADRHAGTPDDRFYRIGFRLVRAR